MRHIDEFMRSTFGPTVWLRRALADVRSLQALSPNAPVRVVIDDVRTCEERDMLVDVDDTNLDWQSTVLCLQSMSCGVGDTRRAEGLAPERAAFNDMLFGDLPDCPAIVIDDTGEVDPIAVWRAVDHTLHARTDLLIED